MMSKDSLLEAFREPAVVLDRDGRVILGNARFTGLNLDGALAGERFAPGSDYGQTCALARGAEPTDALSRGLRAILAGEAESFTHVQRGL